MPPRDRDRFELISPERANSAASFAEEVQAGLTAAQKSLPCRFLYDEAGSRLFEEICDLPEYYPTRTERSILERRAEELARSFAEPASLVELGSGSASKTRILIEALLKRQRQLTFSPVDISRSALRDSTAALLEDYPGLRIRAVEGEYDRALHCIREASHAPTLVLWLGSSIGNLDRPEAIRFVARLRAEMVENDRLLVGVDLRKERRTLERAYDDARGVTARFNLNLLARIDRELGGEFRDGSFRHRAVYREDSGRVELHLVSQTRQRVRIEKLDLVVEFEAGETIHTENSYKYSLDEIDALAVESGMTLEAQWLDERKWFSVNLFAPA
ncbi:MAG: L-histidine N(alpha)-methyltransferase [Proteobacteria bacterium]|nr:L-histidine N(alpha)-methyltransferase [Pseudomonadota bacterium]